GEEAAVLGHDGEVVAAARERDAPVLDRVERDVPRRGRRPGDRPGGPAPRRGRVALDAEGVAGLEREAGRQAGLALRGGGQAEGLGGHAGPGGRELDAALEMLVARP